MNGFFFASRVKILLPLTCFFLLSPLSLFSITHSQKMLWEKEKVNYYKQIPRFEQLRGYKLKTALAKVIRKTHDVKTYNDLWKVFQKSDIDTYYDKDRTLIDIYSENPNHRDPFNYQLRKSQCGVYRKEGDCYNREHLFPQSIFGKLQPMKADFFHIYPTDGMVNNRRSRNPFGEVHEKSVRWRSKNNSKLGKSISPGYTGRVFEPLDEFKGDIARGMLYFATRYENQIDKWNWVALNNTKGQVYQKWFLRVLIKWHRQDPPSDYEIKRNQVGFQHQKNRNPFVDHPELVSRIWDMERVK
ncbi:endonuclease [Bacteriovoracaceae bacterium]|nr:endonuclease [Bacteriovoracaceae bacterium]